MTCLLLSTKIPKPDIGEVATQNPNKRLFEISRLLLIGNGDVSQPGLDKFLLYWNLMAMNGRPSGVFMVEPTPNRLLNFHREEIDSLPIVATSTVPVCLSLSFLFSLLLFHFLFLFSRFFLLPFFFSFLFSSFFSVLFFILSGFIFIYFFQERQICFESFNCLIFFIELNEDKVSPPFFFFLYFFDNKKQKK